MTFFFNHGPKQQALILLSDLQICCQFFKSVSTYLTLPANLSMLAAIPRPQLLTTAMLNTIQVITKNHICLALIQIHADQNSYSIQTKVFYGDSVHVKDHSMATAVQWF